MNSLERIIEFQNLIRKCEEEKQWVGVGNPLAPILIVGKEPAIDVKQGEDDQIHIMRNVMAVRDCFNNGDLVNLYLQPHPKRATSTWNKYQILLDYILYDKKVERSQDMPLPFGAYSFITEMNNSVSLNTKSANKKIRVDFFKHPFFQDFPVVILACWDYIRNDGENRQIDNTFDVRFEMNGENRIGEHLYDNGLKFYIHRNEDKTKLVIHTHQLSQAISDRMLQDMAKIIREHLDKIGKFPYHLG